MNRVTVTSSRKFDAGECHCGARVWRWWSHPFERWFFECEADPGHRRKR